MVCWNIYGTHRLSFSLRTYPVEELPELMREIQDMRMNLCDTEKLEDAQQEVKLLKP